MHNIFSFFSSAIIITSSLILESEANNPEIRLVKYYTEWCGHCKKFAPVYENVQKYYENQNVQVSFVNCEKDKEICKANGIRGYPTVKLHIGEKSIPYSGSRTLENIVEFVNKFYNESMKNNEKQNDNECNKTGKQNDNECNGIVKDNHNGWSVKNIWNNIYNEIVRQNDNGWFFENIWNKVFYDKGEL